MTLPTPTIRQVRAILAARERLVIPDVLATGKRIDTAVLVPLVVDAEPTVTMMVRASGLRHHAGEVCFPGGKPESGDASLEATALREAQEEVGLPPDAVELIGKLSAIPVATSRYRIHPFVGWVSRRVDWRPSGEVARVLDVGLRELALGRIAYHGIEMTWAGHEILSPFFVFEDGTRLYGASAFVLVELMSVVGPSFGLALPPPRVDGPRDGR